MSARVYFMKRVKEYVSIMSPKKKTDKFTLFIYCNFLLLLSTTVCSQNINKQNVNIADETLTDYSFLSQFVNEFPCLLGHPVSSPLEKITFF